MSKSQNYKKFAELIVSENSDICNIEYLSTFEDGDEVFLIVIDNMINKGFLLTPKFLGELVPETDEWDELHEIATNWVLNILDKNLEK